MLSFIKIPLKFGLRTASNNRYRKDEQEAKKVAFVRTRNKIRRGKKHGYWVNGKATYQAELMRELNKAQDRKQARDKTIDEI